jgi:hypothetical protein
MQTRILIWNIFLVASDGALFAKFVRWFTELILSDGMAFYLAAGGYFPIGQAFGSR